MAHLHLGDVAPNFDAVTTDGNINFHDWAGDSWVVSSRILQTSRLFVLLNLVVLLH